MSITLYTAPDCLRCKIVKGFLAEHQIAYETVDFKADARHSTPSTAPTARPIYRNPEGVEFPLFDDGTVIKQGSGEVIAYLLSGHALEGAVTRSDLLHGWISGLYFPSARRRRKSTSSNWCNSSPRAASRSAYRRTDGIPPCSNASSA